MGYAASPWHHLACMWCEPSDAASSNLAFPTWQSTAEEFGIQVSTTPLMRALQIAQLNASIDEVASSLKKDDKKEVVEELKIA